jgi:hypothetical protein
MFDKGGLVYAKSLPAKLMLRRMLSFVMRITPLDRGQKMTSPSTAVLIGAALVSMSGAAMAHHSFAMFDQANPIDLASP